MSGQGPRHLTVGGKAAVAFFLMEIQVGKEGGGARSTPPLVKLRQLRAAGVKIADPVRVAEFPGMINGSFGTPTPGTRPQTGTSRNLVSFLFVEFSTKKEISRQDRVGTTIANWGDPQHPRFLSLLKRFSLFRSGSRRSHLRFPFGQITRTG